MKYLDLQGIKDAFAKHMIEHRGYSEQEAAIAVSDFPDPYELPYLDEEYIDEVTIDGVDYERNASYTSFWKCGLEGIPMFRFYTYYCIDDIPNHQVGEYINARKLFQVEDLDDDDFPTEEDIEEEASSTFFF